VVTTSILTVFGCSACFYLRAACVIGYYESFAGNNKLVIKKSFCFCFFAVLVTGVSFCYR
jgi:hypothetical protein